MSRQQSCEQRHAAFVQLATELHTQLEDWYDRHPDASFGEIEQEARRLRREFMGPGFGVVIYGRDTGFQLEEPRCPQCAQPMRLWAIGPGAWRAWKVRRS